MVKNVNLLRGVIIGIILLLIGANLFASIIINASDSSNIILYVGGVGPGNFSSIQSAIDFASNGDTVFVYNGVYYENLYVDKTIALIGESTNSTIIDGNYTDGVVYLYGDECSIYQFTIQHGGSEEMLAPGISVDGDNNRIIGNYIKNNLYYGIRLESTFNTQIIGNTLEENNIGIYVDGFSNNNMIFHNNLLNNNQNAYDSSLNTWYNLTLQEGNYWDDYTGEDTNGDGIGETPYLIPSKENEDLYPFVNINGWEEEVEQPDLIITDFWETDGLVYYQIRNIGDLAATSGHYTALYVDNDYKANDLVDTVLLPGQRLTKYFDWDWECIPLEDKIVVVADYRNYITEKNETNNNKSEFWKCDTTSPEIISGPILQDVTNISAVIYWETDEACNSIVKYGKIAEFYDLEESDLSLVEIHSISLTDLTPSTLYHFIVESTDSSENTVVSTDMFFETLPSEDNVNPTVSIIDPGIYQGTVKIVADAEDNNEVEKVKFFIDDELVFTDYTFPYEFSLDTMKYINGDYIIKGEAFDLSGKSSVDHSPFNIANKIDESIPTIEIQSPSESDIVADEIVIWSYLYDDVGLQAVFFTIDGVYQDCTGGAEPRWLPPIPKPDFASVTFVWDTTEVKNGDYTIGIVALDVEGKLGWDTCKVHVYNKPPPPKPKLIVESRKVTRTQNYFKIELKVTNIGKGKATDISINEDLPLFQPIPFKDSIAKYSPLFYTSKPPGQNTIMLPPGCKIESYKDIEPGNSQTYIYNVVPIMYYPKPSTWDPKIGDHTLLGYYNTDGQYFFNNEYKQTYYATSGLTIIKEYGFALANSDYLIVTHPTNLYTYNSENDVHNLFSSMGELAYCKNGVIGYIRKYTQSPNVLSNLIKPGCEWSSKLKSDWTQNGYLLIVGENNIIPGWLKVVAQEDTHTSKGVLTWEPLTDYPYANTYGDEFKPELSVGRIIGNDAKKLRIPIMTSINVYKKLQGYRFERANGFLISGFPKALSGKSSPILTKEEVSKVYSVINAKPYIMVPTIIHTPNYLFKFPNGTIDETKTKSAIKSTFFSVLLQKDVVFLSGHGNWHSWDVIDATDIQKKTNPFNSYNPFVYASSCQTGAYQFGFSLAEAFLEKGAGVYLGATEIGACRQDQICPGADKFFEKWDAGESVALAVKQTKNNLGNDVTDQIWRGVYNVYGDPKYGKEAILPSGASASTSYVTASTEPPSTIDVEIPDYNVTSINDTDYVEIPGGYILYTPGMPIVPYYRVFFEFPNNYQIQDVLITNRSGLVTDTGLNISKAVIAFPGCSECGDQIQSVEIPEWWPDKIFEWDIFENPNNATFAITIYPFYYNYLTTDVKFYKDFSFTVDYTDSSLEITKLELDKDVYEEGELVKFDLEINNNASEQKDVVVNAVIKNSMNEVVSGVFLRVLKDLIGKASYSCTWNSDDFPPGYYSVFLELKDTQGVLFDSRIETFKLGISSGEISNFAVTPKYFNIGDNIEISMTFDNNGTVNITGQAITIIININGDTIKEFRYNFSDLPSYESISFNDIWVTVGEEEGFYKVISYVLYDGGSTEPKTTVIGTKLSLTTIKTVEGPKYGPNDEWVTSYTNFNLTTTDNIDSITRIYYRLWFNEKWIPWIEYKNNFTLSDKGKYYIEFYLVDNFGNVEEVHNQTHYVDDSSPVIDVIVPYTDEAFQDGVTLEALITDDVGVDWVTFSIREPSGEYGTIIDEVYESITPTYIGDNKWQLSFDTTVLLDGYYLLFVEANDMLGNQGNITVDFSIRNWAVIELLPNTENNKAGRTMPIKFSLRIAEAVDPEQPFVRNEELNILIYEKDDPETILQNSTYGDSSTNYRINSESELYITNFKTSKTPTIYIVEIWRKNMLLDSFEFETVK